MAYSFDDFLKTVPVSDLAREHGVSEREITEAVALAAPTLAGGMAVNASSEEGASQLIAAASQHRSQSASLADIDRADGSKIVKKVLGNKEPEVTNALSAKGGESGIGSLIPKLLPVIAPLIMQFLSGNLSKGDGTTQSQSGGLGDILGGLLGGGSSHTSSGGLGDVLGGLLGGNSSNSSSGGIGDILGGMLGGGTDDASTQKSSGGIGDILGKLLGK